MQLIPQSPSLFLLNDLGDTTQKFYDLALSQRGLKRGSRIILSLTRSAFPLAGFRMATTSISFDISKDLKKILYKLR